MPLHQPLLVGLTVLQARRQAADRQAGRQAGVRSFKNAMCLRDYVARLHDDIPSHPLEVAMQAVSVMQRGDSKSGQRR